MTEKQEQILMVGLGVTIVVMYGWIACQMYFWWQVAKQLSN